MGPRRTEQIKLIAAYLNGLAIAVFAVGGFAPLFSGNMPHPGDPGFWGSAGLIAGCWIASPILHLVARRALEKLPNDEPSDL